MAAFGDLRHKVVIGDVAAAFAVKTSLPPGSAEQALQPGGSDPTSNFSLH